VGAPAAADSWVSIHHGEEVWSWRLSTIWKLSQELPTIEKSLADLGIEGWTFWINGRTYPVAELPLDYPRLADANLQYPIIFSAGGTLLDGRHRAVRAWRKGWTTIRCVQFSSDPPPERIGLKKQPD